MAIAFSIGTLMAVPAHKGAVKTIQPDGSTVTISLQGDEYLHFYTTEDGYSIVKDANNRYVYAELKDGQLQPTAMMAHDAAERTAAEQNYLRGVKKYLAPRMSEAVSQEYQKEMSRRAATRQQAMRREPQYDYNNFRGLIILVQYSDKSFSRSDYATIANNVANAENYSGFGSNQYTGSVRDYFNDISGGLFKPEFTVVGPITVNRNQYYPNATQKAAQLIYDVVNAADSQINFSEYDGDGDGIVDMIYFIFAGYGSNYSGNDSRYIWPHASQCYNPTTYNWVWKDGVRLGRYACSTELYGWENQGSKIIDGIGTICHEFSHVLGLPDTYDTDYNGSGGQSIIPGEWDIMSGGSYHNYARTPVGYTLYERYAVGFATPQLLNAEGQYTLQNVSTNTGYRINTRQENEFFLLENRQQDKWNKYAPGHGMLVFRVDSTDTNVWYQNQVNVNPNHNYFELLRANGYKNKDAASDPFPGTQKVTRLNNTTSPANLKTWAGKESPWGLDNIKETNGVITFNLIDFNVLSSVSLPASINTSVGISYPLSADCYPETAPCTLVWKSDNEAIATVDQQGMVKGVGVGTTTITVVANNNESLKATCQVTVTELANFANIQSFKENGNDDPGKLVLSDAQVLFVRDTMCYVRDASGSIVFVNSGLDIKTGNLLNGFIAGNKMTENGIDHLIALEGANHAANITVTEGAAPEPIVLTLDQVNATYYSNLITITGVKLSSTTINGVKGVYASQGDINVRVYNSFGLDKSEVTMPKNYTTMQLDVTGILLNTLGTDNTPILELGLTTSPVKTEVNGVNLQTTGKNQPSFIFTPDGRKVQQMSKPGLYIIRQGNETKKVIVK